MLSTENIGINPCRQTNYPNKKLCKNYLSKAKSKRWRIDCMMQNPDGEKNCNYFVEK